MIYLEDLQKAKEKNEQTIQENKEIVVKKQQENCELEAENRVFDKLILLEKSKCNEVEQKIIEEDEQQLEAQDY